MSKWLLAAGIFGFVLTAYAQEKNGTKNPATGDAVSFAKDVVPIISKRCLPCHAEENFNPSELSLDSYDKLMAGGKHGVPVIAGDANKSILVQKLSATPPFGDPMPRERKKKKDDPWTKQLSAEEIKVISDWIDQGAKNN
jgi:uncharacterized membrane protein